jgi:hypothetical protein
MLRRAAAFFIIPILSVNALFRCLSSYDSIDCTCSASGISESGHSDVTKLGIFLI